MNNQGKFIWLIEYIISIILMLIVFGIGGVLTLVSVGIVMLVHYLLYGANLLLGKLLEFKEKNKIMNILKGNK